MDYLPCTAAICRGKWLVPATEHIGARRGIRVLGGVFSGDLQEAVEVPKYLQQ